MGIIYSSDCQNNDAFLKDVDSLALANEQLRLNEAFKAFFSKTSGYPKYKSKHDDQDRASNKVEELKHARNQYREFSDNTYKSTIVDADSYKMQDL